MGVNLDAEHSWVREETARLKQVFRNLLKNAAKFIPAEGAVTISSRNNQDRTLLLVEIRDNGITPEALPRILTPFEQGEQSITRRFGGLGWNWRSAGG